VVVVNVTNEPKAETPPDNEEFHIQFDEEPPVVHPEPQPIPEPVVEPEPEAAPVEPGIPATEPEPAAEPEIQLDAEGRFLKPVKVGKSEYHTVADVIKARQELEAKLQEQAEELGRLRPMTAIPAPQPDQGPDHAKEAAELYRLYREDPVALQEKLDAAQRARDNGQIEASIAFTNDPDGYIEQKLAEREARRETEAKYVQQVRQFYGPERFDALKETHTQLARDVFGYVNEQGVRVPPKMGRVEMLHLLSEGISVRNAKLTGREPVVNKPVSAGGEVPPATSGPIVPRGSDGRFRVKQPSEEEAFAKHMGQFTREPWM